MNDPFYQRAEAKWQLGIVQGLVAARRTTRPTSWWRFLYYRGRYDAHLDQGLLLASAVATLFPDQDGIFQNSLLVGRRLPGRVEERAHGEVGCRGRDLRGVGAVVASSASQGATISSA